MRAAPEATGPGRDGAAPVGLGLLLEKSDEVTRLGARVFAKASRIRKTRSGPEHVHNDCPFCSEKVDRILITFIAALSRKPRARIRAPGEAVGARHPPISAAF